MWWYTKSSTSTFRLCSTSEVTPPKTLTISFALQKLQNENDKNDECLYNMGMSPFIKGQYIA